MCLGEPQGLNIHSDLSDRDGWETGSTADCLLSITNMSSRVYY